MSSWILVSFLTTEPLWELPPPHRPLLLSLPLTVLEPSASGEHQTPNFTRETPSLSTNTAGAGIVPRGLNEARRWRPLQVEVISHVRGGVDAAPLASGRSG